MSMAGIGKQVRKARDALSMSQAKLAKLAGLSQSAIAEIESERTLTSPKIVEIAKALQVTPEWLTNPKADKAAFYQNNPLFGAFGSGPAESSPKEGSVVELGGEEYARLPVFDIRFAAGYGSENHDESPVSWHTMNMQSLRSFTDAPVSQVAVFQADGDSMEPKIHNRDWVMVDLRRNRPTNPGIYALVFEGDGFLKHTSQDLETGAITLVSANPAYRDQTISSPETLARLKVIGRVFLSITRH